MHLTWDVSIGQLVMGVPVVTLALYVVKTYRMMLMFRLEHELLMRDWADRQTPMKRLEDLPWRQKRWW